MFIACPWNYLKTFNNNLDGQIDGMISIIGLIIHYLLYFSKIIYIYKPIVLLETKEFSYELVRSLPSLTISVYILAY